MKRIKEVIVVEGRYDKSAVASVVDATIIEVSGFQIFSNKEKVSLLRKLAEKNGLIVLTDSDSAGFFIRGRLKGMMGNGNIKHAYIPDVYGKEKRKAIASKEGKLGVEAMGADVILRALAMAGATFEGDDSRTEDKGLITNFDLFELGLSGGSESGAKRREFLHSQGLPQRLSSRNLLDVLNILFTREELFNAVGARGDVIL